MKSNKMYQRKIVTLLLFVFILFIGISLSTTKAYAFGELAANKFTDDKDKLSKIITEVMVEANLDQDALIKHIGIVDDASDKKGEIITGAILLQVNDVINNVKSSDNILDAVKSVVSDIKNQKESFNGYVQQSKDLVTGKTPNNTSTSWFFDTIGSNSMQWISNVFNKTELNAQQAGEIFKNKKKIDQEAMESLGLDGLSKNMMDALFQFNENYNGSIDKMSEEQKKFLQETNMYFVYQLEPTQLGERLMKVVGSDTKVWNDLFRSNNIKSANDLNKLINDININRAKIESLLSDPKNYEKIADKEAGYDSQKNIEDRIAELFSTQGDPSLTNKGFKNAQLKGEIQTELVKLLREFEEKYGVKYVYNPNAKSQFNFGQFGSDGKVEEVGQFNYRYFPVITKVRFTVTRKSGPVGGLTLANDSKLQEVASKYSGIGSAYKSITGSYMPTLQEVGRSYNKVVYEVDYAEGISWDDLRNKMSGVYKQYRPAIALEIKNEGIYTINAEIFAKQLVEKDKVHEEHSYSWYHDDDECDGHTETCPLFRYWPYYQQLKKLEDGNHKVETKYTNKEPDIIGDEVQIGYVDWEVNATKGLVEIPVMGKDVTTSNIITK
ncbi:hypothetical protein [Alkaliphilus sp. B6464]|uniref:hypothetical protein n=1 Tax=Alkaliphilus sp. B6464 TaxID=2731219 RepID=UPI001BAE4DEB|nr:hypothetical protein [Alkaliphilus sp. B6464]QUH22037.1 hypothetical protein HYG84_19215 [Alkaliphilus sp. B6464]